MGIKGKNKPKIVVLLGPTASGKSDLAVKLAKKFNGEVISADSRQVYKGMDVGTGKIKKEEMQKIPHHLLDVISPKRRFSVSQYKKLAEKEIQKILKKEKLPIICGGTAFYIKALVDGIIIPEVSPDWNLRKILEKKTTETLYQKLLKLDSTRAKKIDKNNKRRLIRALEIIEKTKNKIPKTKTFLLYNPLFLGIKIDQEKLNRKIDKRLKKRLSQKMIEEVKKLRRSGVSFKRLEEFGLEYKWVALYLQKKFTYEEAIESLSTDIKKFSKRQMVWWKHDKRISWIENYKQAEKITKDFLKTKNLD
jgi:tRNA dimethylallyltransferase